MDEYFKVSSGLKNLIGSDLITDHFVAVFELVKNSFDARATEVDISFENIYTDNAKIVIKDNGKGMDHDDLISKWLFVAYSAKRDDTEDSDYRDKVSLGRHYAGAKGVGRFSCDRLGRYLTLTSKKDSPNSKFERLIVDWRQFELDQHKEFSKIPVKHETLTVAPFKLNTGTVLEISGITRDFWNRENFKKLKERLSKLIRPDLNESDSIQNFKISLTVPDEVEEDSKILEKLREQDDSEIQLYYNTINGEIKNFVFQELNIKTTKIQAEIGDDGIITTKLTDRENFIYIIKEKSKYPLLKGISITLYFLNRSAKIIFKKRTGVEHIDYGSLFVYKNGFRVYPYGERRDDSLGLENRALQGYARYIGLRSLIGEISIQGDNYGLRETTSRGDGLVRTGAYDQLSNIEDGFLVTVLRRLEKYVVDVTAWGVNDDNIENLSDKEVKIKLVKLITNITDDKSIIELVYNDEIINIISNQEQKSAKKLVRNFKRIAGESGDESLYKDAERLEKAVNDSVKRVQSAERERDQAVSDKNRTHAELQVEKSKNLYLTATRKTLSPDAEDLIHGISFNLTEVDQLVSRLIADVSNDRYSPKQILLSLSSIKFFSEKALKVSQLITRANFKHDVEAQFIDVPEYSIEYLNIYNNLHDRNNLNISLVNHGASLKKWISVLDLSLLYDNLISNAIKWKRTEITNVMVEFKNITAKSLEIIFQDDGKGLSENLLDIPEKMFELGVTETSGSGIGLHSVQRILNDTKGSIVFLGNGVFLLGAAFKIIINK